jgi:hypothetical protein
MALDTNFNLNPYYDDFDEAKKYLRLLFKPGYAVQARELTQIQSLLQNQVERFGSHVFKNGSVVSGGQFFIQDAVYLKLNSAYNSIDIDVTDFSNKTILSADSSKRGEVIVSFDANIGSGDPKTLMVKQIYGDPFVAGETIRTSEAVPVYGNVATSGVGTGQIFSVAEGVFYYDGFFIQNDAQTVATSKYNNTTATARIGFEVQENIVTNNSDTSLLDPAQDASNYQAPGSDRYNIELVLATRALDSIDDTKFIELARVENGYIVKSNKYPLYAVLEETLARRTYDESGNYTVKPFNITLEDNSSNTAQTNVILSPGKAYVYGYEYETNSPTTLIIDKPRTTSSFNNKKVTADYGNFVYTTNHFGSFPINSLTTIDLHCVNTASINTSTTGTIANTKIGSARIKSVAYDSASNTSNAQTYQYKSFLFDVNVNNSITGNANSVSTNTTQVQLFGTSYSKVDNAYAGAKLRITSGLGSTDGTKSIVSYNGANQIVVVSSPFTQTPNGSSLFSIDFEFNDTESLVNYSTTTRVVGADIAARSKDANFNNDVFITEPSYEPLIFKLGQEYVSQNSIADLSFSYRKLYQTQSFGSSLSPSLTLGSGEALSSGTSTSTRADNYYITVTTQGTSPYTVGSVIPADKFTVDVGTNRITVVNGNNMVANIISTIDVSSITQKNKTFVTGNTIIQTTGGIDVFSNSAVISYSSNGQCHIASSFIAKTPGTAQSLFVTDVTAITNILDFNGRAITTANAAIATNVTSRYTLDNGQRDSYYDHASIKLNTKSNPPVGPIVVYYSRFVSSGAGFFTVDSYNGINYGDIPVYQSVKKSEKFKLRDCLDFRAERADATVGSGSTITFDVDSSTTGPKIPENGSDITLDYAYYLARVDKVVLDKTKQLQIIKGIPALSPEMPSDTSTGMTLYVLTYPPYVSYYSDIVTRQINHKRYTMRDIGQIEKRVENLEYYTALSLLEQDTLSKSDLTILDTQNLPRFKNGILVDAFKGHSVADVSSDDYAASIDPKNKELRPSFNLEISRLKFDAANSTNYTLTGSLLSANTTTVLAIDQPKASKSTNVNPFNIVNFLGTVKLSPQSDIWVDTDRKPDVLVNIGGDRDAWDVILKRVGVSNWNYEWNSWNTIWTGNEQTTGPQGVTLPNWGGGVPQPLWATQQTTVQQQQTRSGTATSVGVGAITQSIGDRVIDVSIVPFMRDINVLFVGTAFKPRTTLYPFFDNAPVEKYVGDRVNRFYLANNNIRLNTNLSNPEIANVINRDTNTSIGNALIAHVSNNIVHVTNVTANATFNVANLKIVGSQTGLSYDVTSYEHVGGICRGGTANTITLRADAAGVGQSNTYVGTTIFIPEGTGVGQSATITAYNPSTKVATVTPNWTRIPLAGDTAYAIGRIKSDASGSVVSLFSIPAGTFRVGEKLFRLNDNSVGDIPSSSTNGDASFFAQGILQTVEETIVSTVQPTIQRVNVNEERVVTTTVATRQIVVGWYDPLAQTYLISPEQYPEGVYLSKLRFCFKSKDETVPITLQIRPTVNGYPSASVIYPFSTVSLTPDKVKVTASPDLDDATKYTEFVFDSPVYIQPGEHAFVLWSNSNKYEVYTAEMGKLDLVTSRQISEQPYGGSLFLSQNGSTWTADQNLDMMFRIYRSDFDTDQVVASFELAYPAANSFNYSVIQLMTSGIQLPNTSINHQYKSEIASGGFAGYQSINPSFDYDIIDNSGERKLNPATGNSSFTVRSTLQSSSSLISPILDVSRVGLIAVGNKINNLQLSNDDITIANTGTGYANASDVIVTITGGNGSGASAVANVVANTIDAVYIVDGGFGYTTSPTITITRGAGGGNNASVIYNGEDKKTGGNATARYLTRRVTLADGFDSGDLRVYMTAYKPTGTNIHVYYKVLSASDAEALEDKNWTLMTQIGNSNFVSLSNIDYRELLFAPGSDGVPSNALSYTAGSTLFSSFRTFAIKIVMTSLEPSVIPKIRDLRTIALPAG